MRQDLRDRLGDDLLDYSKAGHYQAGESSALVPKSGAPWDAQTTYHMLVGWLEWPDFLLEQALDLMQAQAFYREAIGKSWDESLWPEFLLLRDQATQLFKAELEASND